MEAGERAVEPVLDEEVTVEDVGRDLAQHAGQAGEAVARAVQQSHEAARNARCCGRCASSQAGRGDDASMPQDVHRHAIERRGRRVERDRVHVVAALDEPAQPRARVDAVEVAQHGDAQSIGGRDRLDVHR